MSAPAHDEGDDRDEIDGGGAAVRTVPARLISVVVPAYEEGAHVRAHLARIARAMEATGRAFEIVLVDDGSVDATYAEAGAAAAVDPRVRVLRHETNRGKGAALVTGTRAARGDVLVYLDADLEIAPEQVPSLLARFERERADVLVGSKYEPGASQRRPLHRVLLSRIYWFVTSLLFRLPIRDTQTGLKILSRPLADAVIPAVRTHRFAWDIEVLVLAHRAGARIVSGPVSVDFLAGGARIGARGVLASAVDTLRVFLRAKTLGAYGRTDRATGARRCRPPACVWPAADDLGLSSSVDRGILEAAAAGRVRSVSVLVDGPTATDASRALAAITPAPRVGVHLRLGGDRLAPFVARALVGLASTTLVRAQVRRQVERARALGLAPVRIDAHRHAAFAPAVFRAMCREARACGLSEVRRPAPVTTWRVGRGPAALLQGGLLALAGIATRGVPRAFRLHAADGIVDLERFDRRLDRGRAGVRGLRGTIEVIAHPARGIDDVPRGERGPDRSGDATRLEGFSDRAHAAGLTVGFGCGAGPQPRTGSPTVRRS